MSGFELAKLIRGIPDCAQTPIIFLSGNTSREHVLMAKQLGGVDYLIKPASYENLLTSVIKHVKL